MEVKAKKVLFKSKAKAEIFVVLRFELPGLAYDR